MEIFRLQVSGASKMNIRLPSAYPGRDSIRLVPKESGVTVYDDVGTILANLDIGQEAVFEVEAPSETNGLRTARWRVATA